MLIRRASYLAAGGFDDDYFAYLEDVDLGWRLWAGGERVRFARDAVVHHRSMATSDLLGAFNRGFLFERNAYLTAYKNYEAGLWERVMPAILLTLISRTQTLLVQNNPATSTLTLDPYAGWIANTARGPGGRDRLSTDVIGGADRSGGSPGSATGGADPPGASLAGVAEVPPAVSASLRRPAVGPLPARDLLAALPGKWRELGTLELLRRATRRLGRRLRRSPVHPTITDERTVAQLRALTYLLANLDSTAAKRRQVQARRRVPDREIFARFPAYLVPTYPGDAHLFAGPGFRTWLPGDLPLVESTLEELMEITGSGRRSAGPQT